MSVSEVSIVIFDCINLKGFKFIQLRAIICNDKEGYIGIVLLIVRWENRWRDFD